MDTKPAALNLVIDWGNSSLKAGWFNGPALINAKRYNAVDALLADLADQPVKHLLVSSTSQPADDMRNRLAGLVDTVWVFDNQTAVPIRNGYGTPKTLGADRLAAAVGAGTLFPEQNCLVMDLGTCLTADFVDRSAVFRGGLISPGLRMRFRAMHEQTARLPLVDLPTSTEEPLSWPDLTATNTQQAMQSGVVNGLQFEMNGIIEVYRREQPDLVVLVCGGDAPFFESRLKPPIFAVPDLVLIGLNRILRYNVEDLQADTPDVNL